MFEVGKRYNFKTVNYEGHSTWNATVVEIQGSLLSLEEDGKSWIFNTACSSFEQAKISGKSLTSGDFVVGLTDEDGNVTEYRPGVD